MNAIQDPVAVEQVLPPAVPQVPSAPGKSNELRNLMLAANDTIKGTTSPLGNMILLGAVIVVVGSETGSLDVSMTWIHYLCILGVALYIFGGLATAAERRIYGVIKPKLESKARAEGIGWDDLVAAVMESETYPALAEQMKNEIGEDALGLI